MKTERQKLISEQRGERLAEYNRTHKRTHGLVGTTEYNIWMGMKSRCNNPNNKDYKNYGERGVFVCERWNKFELFLEDMGNRPSLNHSIDRIDNNGPYSLGNCRWATNKQQARNRRGNRAITFRDLNYSLVALAEILNISNKVLARRLDNGLSPDDSSQDVKPPREIIYKGRSLTILGWAKETGLTKSQIEGRLSKKMPLHKVFSINKKELKKESQLYDYNGFRMTLTELALLGSKSIQTISYRLKSGYSVYDAVNIPIMETKTAGLQRVRSEGLVCTSLPY